MHVKISSQTHTYPSDIAHPGFNINGKIIKSLTITLNPSECIVAFEGDGNNVNVKATLPTNGIKLYELDIS